MADVNTTPNTEPNGKQTAEPPVVTGNSANQEPQQNPEPHEEFTIEGLLAKVAELEAANAKQKNVLDKTLKEKGDITKQYRAVMTEAQQAKIDKENADEEHQKYVKGLEAFKAKAEAKARYALQGMNAEMAEKAAEAEVSGDMDALATIQKQHTDFLLKEEKSKWMATRPQVNAGTGDENVPSKEKFMKMGYQQRVEFKAKYPEIYKEYTK